MKTKTKYDLNHAEVKLQSISDKKNKIWKSVQSDYHRVLRKTYNSLFKIHTGIRHVRDIIHYICLHWMNNRPRKSGNKNDFWWSEKYPGKSLNVPSFVARWQQTPFCKNMKQNNVNRKNARFESHCNGPICTWTFPNVPTSTKTNVMEKSIE